MATLNTQAAPAPDLKPRSVMTRGSKTEHGLPKRGTSGYERPFDFTHHPKRWAWSPLRGGWFPDLGRFPHEPGAGDVAGGPKGEAILDGGEQRLRREEWVIIQPDNPAVVEYFAARPVIHGETFTGTSYLQEWDVKGGGKCYKTAFDKPVPIGNDTNWIKDEPAYNAFLAFLVKRGQVCAFNPVLKRSYVRRQEDSVARALMAVQEDPTDLKRSRYKAARIKLAEMRGEDRNMALADIAETSGNIVMQHAGAQQAAPVASGADQLAMLKMQQQMANIHAELVEMKKTSATAEKPKRKPARRKPGRPAKVETNG